MSDAPLEARWSHPKITGRYLSDETYLLSSDQWAYSERTTPPRATFLIGDGDYIRQFNTADLPRRRLGIDEISEESWVDDRLPDRNVNAGPGCRLSMDRPALWTYPTPD